MDIREVVKAARAKFGAVMKVIRIEEGEYFVACKRDNAPLAGSPYMTITAFCRKEGVAFYWGHYDMTAEDVYSAIAAAENNQARRPVKGFHISNRAHYSRVVERPEIMIGLYYPEGGCEAEFAIRWYDLGGRHRSTAKLEVFDDAWGQFFSLTELRGLAEVTARPVDQQHIIDFLLAAGFTDLTKYEHR